jgi:predicted ATPase
MKDRGRNMYEDLHIVTGAPGTGKSAILSRLEPEVRVVAEPARPRDPRRAAIDRRHGDVGSGPVLVPVAPPRTVDREAGCGASGRWSIGVRRGIPDCVAYATALGVDPEPARRAADTYRYADEVVLMPPWEEIYTVDEERTMSFGDVVMFHEAIVEAYEAAGYRLVELPRDSIERRAEFVRSLVTRGRQANTGRLVSGEPESDLGP